MSEEPECPRLPEVWALHEEKPDSRAASEIRAHAARCPVCGPELRDLERLSALVASGDPGEALPAPSRARMREELLAACRGNWETGKLASRGYRPPFPDSRVSQFPLRLGVALGALAACLALLMLLARGGGPARPPQVARRAPAPASPAPGGGDAKHPQRRARLQPAVPEPRVVRVSPPGAPTPHAWERRPPRPPHRRIAAAPAKDRQAARRIPSVPRSFPPQMAAGAPRAARPQPVRTAAQPERLVIQSEGPLREAPSPRPRLVSIYARGDEGSPGESVAVIRIHREEVGP